MTYERPGKVHLTEAAPVANWQQTFSERLEQVQEGANQLDGLERQPVLGYMVISVAFMTEANVTRVAAVRYMVLDFSSELEESLIAT